MHSRILSYFAWALLTATAALNMRGADANAGDERLRQALKETMLQLRTAQADLANLQASQAGLIDEKKSVTEKYEALKKQVIAEHDVSDKSIATLTKQTTEQKAEVARLKEELNNAKAENAKLVEVNKTSEAERSKLSVEANVLRRKVADRERKNLALFLLGNEILSRYEDFSLGKALAAKEPFVGRSRAKLETLMQDYEDKLADERVKN